MDSEDESFSTSDDDDDDDSDISDISSDTCEAENIELLDLEPTVKLSPEETGIQNGVEITKDKGVLFIENYTKWNLLEYIQYKDINDLISDRLNFLVDGDSLLISAIRGSRLDKTGGGQMLHCVYLCERLLEVFIRIGGNFEMVFFDVWEKIWNDNPTMLLARSVLKHHFMQNVKVPVHEVETVWGEDFKSILYRVRPSFLLCNFQLAEYYFFTQIQSKLATLIGYANILYSIGQEIFCVDFIDISLDVSTIQAFVIEPDAYTHKFLGQISRVLDDTVILGNKTTLPVRILSDLRSLRFIIYVSSTVAYLRLHKKSEASTLVRILLLKCSLLEVLPLKFRAFRPPKNNLPKEAICFIKEIHQFMHIILRTEFSFDSNFRNVADIWHGNLFSKLLVSLRTLEIRQATDLGSAVREIYLYLVKNVNDTCKNVIDPFPISTQKLQWCQNITLLKTESTGPTNEASLLSQFGQLLPTSCHLTWEFCGDVVIDSLRNVTNPASMLQLFVLRNENFKERYHWHSRKELTDELSRILDADEVTKKKSVKSRNNDKWRQKHNARFARYMNVYGNNLEGRFVQTETIIRCSKQVSKSTTIKKKVNYSKQPPKETKAEIIRRKNIERIRCQNEEQDKKLFENSYIEIKNLTSHFLYESALQKVRLVKQNLQTELYKYKVLLLEANLLFKNLKLEFTEKANESSLFIKIFKELFLLLRGLLLGSESQYNLSDADRKEIGYYFHCLNMSDISCEWHLDDVCNDTEMKVIYSNLSWAEFQLKHLGPDLLRENPTEVDSELGFAPDEWQKKLINAIRKRQSVIVVAPTSSGKTYASYYCMKSVLQEGCEGIVVYVSPTKALVNQVAATVYARFKNVEMPPGRSVYGIFTREYRINALTCQILVTVPQCLEILLLSPVMCSWVKKIRYIIFDEIHCLSGLHGGLSWEIGLLLTNCPFLALSATIDQPEKLQCWLQESMNFKKERDKKNGFKKCDSQYEVILITHHERHNDLRKNVYVPQEDSIAHIHPYAYLTNEIVRMYDGIPFHLSLSPDETLLLFNALQKTKQKHTNLTYLTPEIFFRKNSRKYFITRSSVKAYENELREVLSKWAQNYEDSFCFVVNYLKQGSSSLEHSMTKKETLLQVPSFIEALKVNKMFPAIIFVYDRNLIELLLEELNDYLSSKCKEAEDVSEEKNTCMSKMSDIKLVRKGKEVKFKTRKIFSLGLLKGGSSSLRSVGVADSDDMKFIERRLIGKGYSKNDPFVQGLRNCVGIHHAGIDSVGKGTVEMLFRMKVLSVVIATSTLAFGIHMPCKTVVIAGDSQHLTTLNYHQMSGRAGRRGFDVEGNVVFWGLKETKVRRLLTGRLPIMYGNFPLSVTLVLRLLLLVSGCHKNLSQKKCDKASVQEETLSRALTFLNCCLIYQQFPQLKQQMKHFFAFSTQMLMMQKLLDESGNPQHLSSGIVTHLHYHEPGNLVFAYLLRKGVLHEICVAEKNGAISKETQLNVVLLISHLFTNKLIHPVIAHNSVVKLKKLPNSICQVIRQYNKEVKFLFDHYFYCVATECSKTMGEDNVLPLSKISFESDPCYAEEVQGNEKSAIIQEILADYEPRVICSAFAALSGCTDRGLYSVEEDINYNLRHQVFTDKKILPLFHLNKERNAYAWDFYNHGIRKAIIRDNNLRSGDDFTYLKDFKLVLETIYTSLLDFADDPKNATVIRTFKIISTTFRKKFNKAFRIKNFEA